MHKKTISLIAATLFSTSTSTLAEPIGYNDPLGDKWMQKVILQISKVDAENAKLKELLSERQRALSFIKRENDYRYYTVIRGSLRSQLPTLARQTGITTIRWSNDIPISCDWQFDSQFKIDAKNPEKAALEFFRGLPLTPIYIERDKSLNIEPLTVIPECI
ncbi:hypothetical protein [Photobacterium kishitanii]|uniref:hypothetical protein n=1 Tax=Photobacterium kishitanii TaxID=318456 RepID=UPI0007F876F2|nr:hypothetical protein [Photobacterium kishitanii]OBU31245.1 hypothetical protein AYY23_20240 [Photobacterium kishitanii]PSW46657.1 hypothetical protein C0W66_22255 [Photobacterium kishitanii]